MATVSAPLLSFGARGAIGKSVVFSSWKGINVARQYVIPSNPRTVAQQAQRDLFKWVHDAFKYLSTDATASWVAYAKGKAMTAPNAWSSKNLQALSGQTVITDIEFITPVLGGPPNVSTTLTPSGTQIVAVGVPPTLPAGWTITKMIAVLMLQQAPSGEEEPNPSTTLTKSASTWTVTFTGLIAATAYVVGIGWEYVRADGQTAFGGSVNAIASTP